MRIKIFTAGGSIDKRYSTRLSRFTVADPQVASILAEANVSFDYSIDSVLQKDSLDLTREDRELLYQKVAADPASHILITHGSDTMIETAEFLRGIAGKVIVLTGAMQPAAFRISDSHFNVGYAVHAVQTLPPGVYVAMNGRVFDPANVRKNPDTEIFDEI